LEFKSVNYVKHASFQLKVTKQIVVSANIQPFFSITYHKETRYDTHIVLNSTPMIRDEP